MELAAYIQLRQPGIRSKMPLHAQGWRLNRHDHTGTAATNSATILLTSTTNGTDTLIGFGAAAVANGGDMLDFTAIANLTDAVATGQTLTTDFAANCEPSTSWSYFVSGTYSAYCYLPRYSIQSKHASVTPSPSRERNPDAGQRHVRQ